MRVGVICPYSMSVWGGVQGQVLDLARALRSHGVRAQVLAPCDGPPPEPFVTPIGASVPFAENGSFAPLAPDIPAQLRTLAVLTDERFDLLHLHEPLAPGPTLTTLTVKPTPLLGTFHASGVIGPYRYLNPVVRRLAGRLDERVAVSPEAAGMAKRFLGGDYEILHNGVEVGRFADGPVAPTDGPTVFFCGRHEPRKGLSVLLDAVRLLPSDVRVWVAGRGPETARLQAAGDERIEWLGAISDEEKQARLRAADVFCVPSLGGESFGVVLLEAMAAGTAVVASDLEAYRLVARDGRDAFLARTGDPVDLAKQLLVALGAGDEVEERLRSGRERADEFSMARLAEAYLVRYERLAAGR